MSLQREMESTAHSYAREGASPEQRRTILRQFMGRVLSPEYVREWSTQHDEDLNTATVDNLLMLEDFYRRFVGDDDE